MRKFVRSSLVAASLGLTACLVPTGCGPDNAGGNEVGVMDKTEGGRGKVTADTPKTPEDYYNKHRPGKK